MGFSRFVTAMKSGVSAGVATGMDVWQNGPPPEDIESIRRRYTELELVSSGQLFTNYATMTEWKKDPRVYKGISLLWNHTARIPNFYGMLVYQGRLSTEIGEGAIPIVPDESLSEQQVIDLMAAMGVLYRRWNWQRAMKLRPRKASSLGDWPTELVDDLDRQFVYPRPVWPGYVTEVEFDPVGNVEAYTIEHMVTEKDGDREETYRYKKVVTAESFSFFKDGQPFGYNGGEASYKNPYGFAPMIWDRHIDNGIDDRGESAFGATMQQLMNLNSLASHARDVQHKNFLAPVIVGGKMSARKESKINLGMPKIVSQNAPEAKGSAMAEQHHFIEAEPGVSMEQPRTELGETLEWIKWMQDGILEAHPEITFFEKLADQSNVTGPGADKVILPVKSLVEDARDALDPNTVHLFQMAISMCGHRFNNESWGDNKRNGREAFKPFNLDSYDQGTMAFTIAEREVLPPSRLEEIEEIRQIESVRTSWGLKKLEIDEEEAQNILNEQATRSASIFNSGGLI